MYPWLCLIWIHCNSLQANNNVGEEKTLYNLWKDIENLIIKCEWTSLPKKKKRSVNGLIPAWLWFSTELSSLWASLAYLDSYPDPQDLISWVIAPNVTDPVWTSFAESSPYSTLLLLFHHFFLATFPKPVFCLK